MSASFQLIIADLNYFFKLLGQLDFYSGVLVILNKFFLFLVISILITAVIDAAWVDPRLVQSPLSPQGKQTVIVQFKALPDLLGHSSIANLKRKNQIRMNELLQGNLAPFSQSGAVSLWAIQGGGMILDLTHEEIQQLAQNDRVEALIFDEVFELEKPFSERIEKPEIPEDPENFSYGVVQIGAPKVWEEYGITGKNVVVGILDTGWAQHPEVEGRIIASRDFAGSLEDNVASDGQGHGSHCMGTIGGTDASGRSIGVAPGVKFVVARIFDEHGFSKSSKILQAMHWILDPDDNPDTNDYPRVVSNSWGGGKGSLKSQKPKWDIVQAWRDHGIVPVFASGNSGPSEKTVGSPGGFPHSFAVAANDQNNKVTWFSSRGPVYWGSETYIKPDITAPGWQTLSWSHENGGYVKMSGTSMATPHVAGVVALMLEAQPQLSVKQIEHIITSTALKLHAEEKSNISGYGRIDAYKAVKESINSGFVKLNLGRLEGQVEITIQPSLEVMRLQGGETRTFALPEGSYEFNVACFGYESSTLEVTVSKAQTTLVQADLEKAQTYPFSMRVSGEDGTPLQATLRFNGIQVKGSWTAGQFSTRLPAGRYQLDMSARGFYSIERPVEIPTDSTYNYRLETAPQLLLIEKRYNEIYKSEYQRAFDKAGITFDYQRKFKGIPDLRPYEQVIWFSNDAFEMTLSKPEADVLLEYASQGGQLLLIGQYLGDDISETRLLKDILHLDFHKDQWETNQFLRGMGFEFKLGEGWSEENNEGMSSFQVRNEKAHVLFRFEDESVAGSWSSYEKGQILILGFGLEGVDNKIRGEMARKIIDTLNQGNPHTYLDRLKSYYVRNPYLYRKLIHEFQVPEEEEIQNGWIAVLEKMGGSVSSSLKRRIIHHRRLGEW